MKKNIILFGLPVVVWLAIFGGYFSGQPAMTQHGLDYYLIVKYQMDNLMRGVFPFWDPMMFWGRPDNIDSRFIGEFNPFLWVYAVLAWVGVPRPAAFLVYALGYHFVWLAGFYLLAQRIFKDTVWAWLSFILLLFSSVLILVFNNFCVTLMTVPLIWFFYFLIAFTQEPKKVFFVGLVFSSMLLAITYMPFYFLTIFVAVFISFLLFYPTQMPNICLKWSKFAINSRYLVYGGVCIVLSLIPGIQWFLASESGEYILSWRHAGSDSLNAAAMELATISTTGIVGPVDVQWLFSGLQYTRHMLFFVPLFIYVILLISMVNRVTKRSLMLLLGWFMLFLITLTDLTPVHKFLYEHIYFYKLFRNIFYLSYMALIPMLILFAVEQLRLFLEDTKKERNKALLMIFVVVIHGFFAVFLYRAGNIIWSSYVSLILSLGFFLGNISGTIKPKQGIFILFLAAAAVIQPAEVFYHYKKNALGVVEWSPKDRFYPKFSFVRLTREEETREPKVYKGKSPQGVQDTSGFEPWKYTGLNRSFQLHQNVSHDVLERYVKYKFVVYDAAEAPQEENWDFKKFEESIRTAPPYQAVAENSPELTVTGFDLNYIRFRTNFPAEKFLVYNDGYDKNWLASVNGRPVRVFRANYAFKGIWLPAGTNEVEFRYGSPLLYIFTWFMFVLYAAVFVYLIVLGVRYSRGEK